MLTSVEPVELEKRRTLKKVRTQFLAKRPEYEEHVLATVPKPLNPYTMYIIGGAWGLVEQDRQICIGIKYLSSCLNVTNILIQDYGHTREVILRPQISNQSFLMPWEYSVKRLESYGDLELATFAHRIREFNRNYSNLIQKYQKMNDSEDIETNNFVEKARINTMEYRRNIESTYPYAVMTFLYDKNGVNLHSMTFSEAILKEIGQNVEGFARWAQTNGIPALFNDGSNADINKGKQLLSQSIPLVSEVKEESEIETFLCGIDGNKRRIIGQPVRISEPTKDGFIISNYMIIKSCTSESNSWEIDKAIEDYGQRGVKCVRYENQVEISMDKIRL